MKTKTLEMTEIDVEAIINLTFMARQNSPLRRDDRTLDGLREHFENSRKGKDTIMITVHDELTDELLGYLTVNLRYPEMVLIQVLQPVVHPNRDSETIARSLLEHSKRLLQTHSRSRLETLFYCNNKENEEMSSIYIPWYEACGFYLSGEEIRMRAKIAELVIEDFQVPEDIEVIPFCVVDNEEIIEACRETFYESQDKWLSDLTKPQKETIFNLYFDKEEPYDKDSSFVLKKEEDIVGFNITRFEDKEPMLGPIGVLPKHRGKGLGKAIVSLAINRLKSKDVENVNLEVSTANEIAFGLYTGLGFKKQYRILVYSWMPSITTI
ncbi:MAG: GNAT family N-acetyltransferase [Candidatus Hodarchaeales archaeon]